MPANAICAVITDETVEAARRSIQQAAGVADLIEVRLDYLRDFDFNNPDNLRSLLEDKPLPVIITCRAIEEGGKQQIDDTIRLRLLIEGARELADYCDIEAAHYERAVQFSPDPSRLVISYHNFSETPPDLEAVYDRVCALPAAVYKIATTALRVTDTIAIFRLLDRARSEGRKLIALAMDEAGIITRVLGPAHGSFVTYGSLRTGGESAAGQLTCEELRDSYRVHQMSRATAITGIIGQPVAHSLSPAMHNAAFAALGMDWAYLPIEVDDLREFFSRFVRPQTREIEWNLRGLSVTIPHKPSVIGLLDEIDATADKVGAVNTVVVNDGRLIGYNTDVDGAIAPLERLGALEGETCGVIGAGGAARAVVYGLLSRGARVTVFARDPKKSAPLGERFGVPIAPLESLELSDAGILINTTPLGMRGHSEGESPVPPIVFRNRRIAYDLVYNPVETRFLLDAREGGCQTVSGVDMLIEQAALQFSLWTGTRPPVNLMRAAVVEGLYGPDARGGEQDVFGRTAERDKGGLVDGPS